MEKWMMAILIFIIFLGMMSFMVWAISSMLEDVKEMRQIKRFTGDFKGAVKHNQPTWDVIKEIASTRGLTQANMQFVIKRFYREIMTGREEELSPHENLIKGYIDQYEKDEPFEGLPDEIRIHLERLRDQTSSSDHLLEPLTSQIKDLLTVKRKEIRRQRHYTIGGFIVGVASLTFTLYTHYAQPHVDVVIQDQSISQIESANNQRLATDNKDE